MYFSNSRLRLKVSWLTPAALVLALATGFAGAQSTTTPGSQNDPFPASSTQRANAHANAATPQVKKLPDPPADQIPTIIQKFAAKERLFRSLLKNSYTYTESIKVETLDDDGQPTGTYEQTNDIQFTPEGQRQIVCTYCPQSTLNEVEITQEDIDDFFNMDMYTVSIDDLPQYNVRYVDHEPLDELTTYVFDIKPKQIVKGHRYFQGKVWVDDRDLQIVKSFGKAVPNEYDKHGNPRNVFLPFETYRQEIDGKYWFPVFTKTDDLLPPSNIRVRMVIRFTGYKRFRANARIISVQEVPNQQKTPNRPAQNPSPPKH